MVEVLFQNQYFSAGYLTYFLFLVKLWNQEQCPISLSNYF